MSLQETDKFINMILNIEQNIDRHLHNFNYLLYYALYPSFKRKNLTSYSQLLYHYLTIGVLEGRIKNKTDFYSQFPLFDYQLYVSLNKDVKVALQKKYLKRLDKISSGNLEYFAIIHYFTIGRFQGRVISNTDLSNVSPNPNGYPLYLSFLNPPTIGNSNVIIDYANSFVEITDANLYVIEDALPDSEIVSLGNIGSVLYVSNTYPSKVLYSDTVRQLADVLYITAANINNLEVRNNANIGNDFVQISPESLFIAGNTTIDGNLTVNGLIIRNYSQTVNTMVYVNDESYIYQQNVNVTGNIIAGGNLYVDGNLFTDSYSTFYHGLGTLGYVKLIYTPDSIDINDSNGMLGTCSLELTEIGGSFIMLENLFFRQDYEWTVEFFVKLISLPGSTGTIITIGDFNLELTSGGYLIINVSIENSTSTTLLSIDTWYHIAIIYTDSLYTLYIDGNSDVTISADNITVTTLIIGDENFSIAGYISEFRYSSCTRYTESFTSPTEEFTIDDYTVVLNHFNILDDFFGYNFLVSADMSNVVVSGNLITTQFIHSSLGLDVGSNLFIDLSGNIYTVGNVGIGTDVPEYKLDVIGDGNISGNLTVNDIIAGNLIVNDAIIGILSTAAQPNITSLGTLTSLTISGNLTTSGYINGALNVTSLPDVTYIGTLSNLTVNGNATVGNLISSGAIVGTLSTAAQPNITYVGSLSNLTVSGNTTVGGNLTVSGNATVSNLIVSKAIVGTLSTTAQPNITYVGSLSNLTVSGNTTVGGNLTVSGNATVSNLIVSKAIVGTLSTAAQPNITSVGTLTSLTVSSDILMNSTTSLTAYTVITGSIILYAGTTAPTYYLLCNGAAVARTGTYATLFSVIGTTYGSGNGSTTFNLPDLQARFPMGSSTSYTLGTTGGNSTKTLAVTELPSHNHSITDSGHTHTATDSGHTHSYTVVSEQNQNSWLEDAAANGASRYATSTGTGYASITVSSATTGISLANTGSSASFSLLNPYIVMNYYIKY